METLQRRFFWISFVLGLLSVSFAVSYQFLCISYRFLDYGLFGSFVNRGNILNMFFPVFFYFLLLIIPFFISKPVIRIGFVILAACIGTFFLISVIDQSLCTTSLESPLLMIYLPVQYLIILCLAGLIYKFRNSPWILLATATVIISIPISYYTSFIKGEQRAIEDRRFSEFLYDSGVRDFLYGRELFERYKDRQVCKTGYDCDNPVRGTTCGYFDVEGKPGRCINTQSDNLRY